MRWTTRGSRLAWLTLFTGHAIACSTVLGIEELEPGPSPDGRGGSAGGARAAGGATSGAPGAGSTSGGTTTQGGTNVQGGSAPEGGSSAGTSADAGAAPMGEGGGAGALGEGGMGGVDAGGDAGMGGAPTADPTVRGRVIDLLGQPVSNAPVTILGTTALTDAQGEFEIAAVPEQYDASLVVTLTGSRSGSYAWVYQGLTRRDPTLQVYRGRSDVSKQVLVSVSNGAFTSPSNTAIAFGSIHGAYSIALSAAESYRSIGWYGPSTAAGTLHALRWTNSTEGLPASFQSYAQRQFTVDAESASEVVASVVLPDTPVTPGAISGQITSPTTLDRNNHVFARFSSGASIRLVNQYTAPATFNYFVPALAGSVITVAACEGRTPGQFAVAHEDVAPGQADISLEIPEPPLQLEPGDAATEVGSSTRFRWQTDAGVSLFHIEDRDFYRGIFVVTSQKEATIPALPSYNLRAGGDHYWQIEVHGDWSSVDAATGPSGFQDSFGPSWTEPQGPRRGGGTFAMSYRSFFTTSP